MSLLYLRAFWLPFLVLTVLVSSLLCGAYKYRMNQIRKKSSGLIIWKEQRNPEWNFQQQWTVLLSLNKKTTPKGDARNKSPLIQVLLGEVSSLWICWVFLWVLTVLLETDGKRLRGLPALMLLITAYCYHCGRKHSSNWGRFPFSVSGIDSGYSPIILKWILPFNYFTIKRFAEATDLQRSIWVSSWEHILTKLSLLMFFLTPFY